MSKIREAVEGTQVQGTDEQIAYTIDTANWGGTPTSVSVVVYDTADGTNATTTVMPTNSPSVDGDVITLSLLKALTVSHTYRIEVKFTNADSNVLEAYVLVQCE